MGLAVPSISASQTLRLYSIRAISRSAIWVVIPGSSGGFDWGLPFFFGRNVFVAIQGQSTRPGGTAPYWAY